MADEVSLELTLSCSSSSGKRSRESSSSDITTQEEGVSKRRKLINNGEGDGSISSDDEHRNQASKIAAMKVYTEEEEEEEKKLTTRLRLHEDTWTIKKVLQESDVNGSSRLLLSTHVVEEHIIKKMDQNHVEKIYSGEGARITVCDYDTDMSEYQLTLKRWPSTRSFVLINNWRRDFEKRRGLKCNDEIAMLWDPFKCILWFRVLKQGSS